MQEKYMDLQLEEWLWFYVESLTGELKYVSMI